MTKKFKDFNDFIGVIKTYKKINISKELNKAWLALFYFKSKK